MNKIFFALGAVIGCLGIIAGAFGAHALKAVLAPERMELFQTAARYQMYSAFALIAAAYACDRWPSPSAGWAGWLFVAGTLIFCGTVYALAFDTPRWLGAITPLGGLCIIVGWALLAWSALRAR